MTKKDDELLLAITDVIKEIDSIKNSEDTLLRKSAEYLDWLLSTDCIKIKNSHIEKFFSIEKNRANEQKRILEIVDNLVLISEGEKR